MSTDEVRQLLGEGAQLMKEGKLGEAIAKLKSAADLDPSSVQARSYLGAAYARDGQGPASVEQFQAAVDLDPDNPVHNFNLGQAFEVAGSKPRAMQLYEKALALDPKYAKARQRLDALTGGNKPAPTAAAAAPAATQMSGIPGVPAVQQPAGPPPAAPVGGPPQYGAAPTQYGAPAQYGAAPQPGGPLRPSYDPSLGLGRQSAAYSNPSSSGKRLLAAIIDALLLGAVIGIAVFATKPAGVDFSSSSGETNAVEAWMQQIRLVSMWLTAAYVVGFNTACAATPGKMALGMRIVKTDGSKMGFLTALGRYIIQSIISSFTCSLGMLSIVFNSERRGWHDQAAGTVVVDK